MVKLGFKRSSENSIAAAEAKHLESLRADNSKGPGGGECGEGGGGEGLSSTLSTSTITMGGSTTMVHMVEVPASTEKKPKGEKAYASEGNRSTESIPTLKKKGDSSSSVATISSSDSSSSIINQHRSQHLKPHSSSPAHKNIGDSQMVAVVNPNNNNSSSSKSSTNVNAASNYGDSTDSHVNKMKKGESKLMVAVRIRPLSTAEKMAGAENIAEVLDKKVVVLKDPIDESDDILRANRSREKRYAFDVVFEDDAPQNDVYMKTTNFLLDGVMSGYNATVFAYGATGAGKTFTMLGSSEEPGIMELTLKDLFAEIAKKQDEMTFRVTISYLEIYNEMIRDLLDPLTPTLELREDGDGGVRVPGLMEVEAISAAVVMKILHRGNRKRTMEPTAANKHSSRSHAVLQVTVEQKSRTPDVMESVKVGKLSMIDLAGSERAAQTQNKGIRMIEGANINRSLLALGNCINALGERSNEGQYVNYRDSKLTRLLKDSLGGNCRTVKIAHISPASNQFEESHNTLKYANRAKNIKTKVKRNVLNVEHHIAQYSKIITDLRSEISRLKGKLADTPGGDGEGIIAKIESSTENDQRTEKEKKSIRKLEEEIKSNFHECIGIHRSLNEVEDLLVRNSIQIESRVAEVKRMEVLNGVIPSNDCTAELKCELEELIVNQKENQKVKAKLLKRLEQNEKVGANLESEVPLRISNPEARNYIGGLYKLHITELDLVENEAKLLNSERLLKQKDAYIKKIEQINEIQEALILEQRALLSKHKITNKSIDTIMERVEQEKVMEAIKAAGDLDIKSPLFQNLNLSLNSSFDFDNMTFVEDEALSGDEHDQTFLTSSSSKFTLGRSSTPPSTSPPLISVPIPFHETPLSDQTSAMPTSKVDAPSVTSVTKSNAFTPAKEQSVYTTDPSNIRTSLGPSSTSLNPPSSQSVSQPSVPKKHSNIEPPQPVSQAPSASKKSTAAESISKGSASSSGPIQKLKKPASVKNRSRTSSENSYGGKSSRSVVLALSSEGPQAARERKLKQDMQKDKSLSETTQGSTKVSGHASSSKPPTSSSQHSDQEKSSSNERRKLSNGEKSKDAKYKSSQSLSELEKEKADKAAEEEERKRAKKEKKEKKRRKKFLKSLQSLQDEGNSLDEHDTALVEAMAKEMGSMTMEDIEKLVPKKKSKRGGSSELLEKLSFIKDQEGAYSKDSSPSVTQNAKDTGDSDNFDLDERGHLTAKKKIKIKALSKIYGNSSSNISTNSASQLIPSGGKNSGFTKEGKMYRDAKEEQAPDQTLLGSSIHTKTQKEQ
eukprot:Nk52_evm21s250 gene=Nk52_evmTU21s250